MKFEFVMKKEDATLRSKVCVADDNIYDAKYSIGKVKDYLKMNRKNINESEYKTMIEEIALAEVYLDDAREALRL